MIPFPWSLSPMWSGSLLHQRLEVPCCAFILFGQPCSTCIIRLQSLQSELTALQSPCNEMICRNILWMLACTTQCGKRNWGLLSFVCSVAGMSCKLNCNDASCMQCMSIFVIVASRWQLSFSSLDYDSPVLHSWRRLHGKTHTQPVTWWLQWKCRERNLIRLQDDECLRLIYIFLPQVHAEHNNCQTCVDIVLYSD